MFKKVFSLILVFCVLFSLSACEQQKESNEDAISTSNNEEITNHVHSYSRPSCTNPMTCSCGATAGVALGHNFSLATCTAPPICQRCGYASDVEYGHKYSEASCYLRKKCSVCGETSGEPLGHEYENDICVRCGETNPDILPVALHELTVIDRTNDYISSYKYDKGVMKDTFGKTYSGYHIYSIWYNGYSIHYLEWKYSKLSFDIVVDNLMPANNVASIEVYADDILLYNKTDISRTTSKIHVELNVSNREQLKFKISSNGKGGNAKICLVNAVLTK